MVPVGAIVLGPDGRELSAATNRREADGDPFAHAEVLALRAAARELGDGWRLEDCTLVVTLEPCTMCAGAAVASRVGHIVFGAWEPKTGACGSLWDVVRDRRLTHRPEVRGGVLETANQAQGIKLCQRIEGAGLDGGLHAHGGGVIDGDHDREAGCQVPRLPTERP